MTRTNKSGWSSALWGRNYHNGCIKINFYVDNDGGSKCLLIGLLKAAESYDLMSISASDYSDDS